MRSITNYFISPVKIMKEITSDKDDIHKPDNSDTTHLISKSGADVNVKKHKSPHETHKKRRKEKHKRPSDPTIRNITQLLLSNLYLVSPDKSEGSVDSLIPETSPNKLGENTQNLPSIQNSVIKVTIERENNKKNETEDLKDSPNKASGITRSISTQSSPDNEDFDIHVSVENDIEKDNNRKNAFQYMMDSRNKSIGMNSPGKEIMEEVSEEIVSNKETIATRRNLLSAWAEQKSVSKRKREEELDETIKYKLNKRARRLKTLLNVDVSKVVDDLGVTKKVTKRIRRISSSNESDSDFEVVNIRQKSKRKYTTRKSNTIIHNANSKNVKLKCTTKSGKVEKKIIHNITTSSNEVQEDSSPQKQSISDFSEVSPNSMKKSRRPKNSKKNSALEVPQLKKVEPSPVYPDENSENISINSSKISKNKKIDNRNSEQQSKDSSLRSQRRLRSWRIKMNSSEGVKNPISDKIDGNSKNGNNESPIKILSSESDEESIEKKSKNPVKIAPMFVKSTPKPKLDPKVIEARKQFLMSGIPTSLRKIVEKEKSFEERELVVFPTISHIQQRCSNILWNLPIPELNLKDTSPFKTNGYNSRFENFTKSSIIQKLKIQMKTKKIDNLKSLLNKIKRDNPDYPVYKSYRIISEKCGLDNLNEFEKRKSTPKRSKDTKRQMKSSEKSDTSGQKTNNNIEYSMWTDKYKPRCADDIIGNSEAIRNLKKWLIAWMNFSQDINSAKKKNDCSESEFETADGDSNDSMMLPGNTIVLEGPCGSGKSTAVYAISYELDFNVIELNASSKRTGKKLLQKVQEATQSHQVRKGETADFRKLFENVTNAKLETIKRQTENKMVVILIEDIDIVFEQDEGFISALTYLISTSKRPIILTTTDYNSLSVQKFLGQYEYISFTSLTSYSLSTWLQILCLVEGMYVDKNDLGYLLNINNGDVRKTLLQLQYWVKSGGQLDKTEIPIKMEDKRRSCDEQLVEDEQVPFSDKNDEVGSFFVHRNCIKSFELFEFENPLFIPYHLSLGKFWWNIPCILDMPVYSKDRVDKLKQGTTEENISKTKVKMTEIDRKKLKCITALYDSLSLTDVTLRKVNHFGSSEPIVRNICCMLSDSSELRESCDSFNGNLEFAHELSHNLVNRSLKIYNSIDCCTSRFNMSAPDWTERRWRNKQKECEDNFRDAITTSNILERKSAALDYFPVLRGISRTELVRSANNTKRGKRFRNYLRDLGLNGNSSVMNLACNILKD